MTRLAVRDGKEIKKRTRSVVTSLINGPCSANGSFPLGRPGVEDQFTTHLHLRDGKIIYSKWATTTSSTVRCAMLIREGNLAPVGEGGFAQTGPHQSGLHLIVASPTLFTLLR